MKIVDVRTTLLRQPGVPGIQDATIRHRDSGRSALFVHIRTDEGIEGLGIGTPVARGIIETALKPLLLEQDPLCHEKLWDDMFWRVRGYGRKGVAFCAISAVDIALWDLKAKFFGVPLYRLLGPYTDRVPIYGSGGWTSFTEAELVREQMGYLERGIPRVKMKVAKDFGRSEAEDIRRVAAVRKAVGDDVEIYVDANNGFYAKQAIGFARRMAEYDVRWIEEPVLADKIDACAEIRARSRVPIATGEHEYTRWGLKQLMDARAADVLQPDIYWAGGISEMLKIAALASTYELVLIPHGHSTPATAQFIAAQPPTLCPILEYLIKWNEIHQFFFRNPLKPVRGMITVPTAPGMGVELDEAKIEGERELRWSA